MATARDARPDAPAELALDFTFSAPREQVYDNWLRPELLQAWFAPDGYRVTRCEVDPRPGGAWRVEYRSASGESHAEYGELLELARPEKLAFTLTQADAHGHVGPKTTVTVWFQAAGGNTSIRFQQAGFSSAKTRDGNAIGWGECFAKLAASLAALGNSSPADAQGEREIRALHEAWWQASESKDLDASMAPIAPSILSYEHQSPLQVTGIDALRESCRQGFEATPAHFRWDIPDLQVIVRGDLAVAWGLNHMRGQAPGAAPFDSWSRGTRVFRKLDGRWQMVHQHVSFPYDPETGAAQMDLKPGL